MTPDARSSATSATSRNGISAGGTLTRSAKAVIGILTKLGAHELGGCAGAEWPRLDENRGVLGRQAVDQSPLRAQLARTVGEHDPDRSMVKPAGDEQQPPQRALVGPMRVVDDDHQRRGGREAGTQAVQTVVARPRRVLTGRRDRSVSDANRSCRRDRQAAQLLGGERRPKQLRDDAEGVITLEFTSPAAEDPRSGRHRSGRQRVEKDGLSDPGRALDQRQSAALFAQARHERLKARQFLLALQQGSTSPKRSLPRFHADLYGRVLQMVRGSLPTKDWWSPVMTNAGHRPRISAMQEPLRLVLEVERESGPIRGTSLGPTSNRDRTWGGSR